jgi:hypothetical protein
MPDAVKSRRPALRQAQLGLTAQHGASFFASYGAQTLAKWRTFGAALDAWCLNGSRAADAAATAIATFESLERWLCDARKIRGVSTGTFRSERVIGDAIGCTFTGVFAPFLTLCINFNPSARSDMENQLRYNAALRALGCTQHEHRSRRAGRLGAHLPPVLTLLTPFRTVTARRS